MPGSGLFFVLEGSDGSGKATQLNLLRERLAAAGYDVEVFDFPRYDEPSSYFVKQYLEGSFGPSVEVSPYTASLFYALDRYEAAPLIRQALSDGKIVLSNRYVGANMAHQGSKFGTEAEQRGFFLWADSLEFQLMGIPRPNLNLFLRLPAQTTFRLIKQRARQQSRKLDGHEASNEHLEKTLATYDLLCQLFPKDFTAVECAPEAKLLPIANVSDLVWTVVKPLLPPPPHPGKARTVRLDQHPAAPAPKKPLSEPLAGAEIKKPGGPSLEISLSLLMLKELQATSQPKIKYELLWFKAKKPHAFYIPPGMSPKLRTKYIDFMEQLASQYLTLEKALNKSIGHSGSLTSAETFYSALRPVVPLAATVRAELRLTAEEFKAVVSRLALSPQAEAQKIIDQMPVGLQVKRSGASDTKKIDKLVSRLIDQPMPQTLTGESRQLEILSVMPQNEFDLLAEAIYPHADRPLAEIKNELDSWKYSQKLESLEALSHLPGSWLKQANYRFDALSSQIFIEDLVELGIIGQMAVQAISPRSGYKIPKIIEDAGLDDILQQCFDKSLELYSALQSAGHNAEASYACLMGHRSRWQFSLNAEALKETLESSTLSARQLEIIKLLIARINEQHPVIGDFLANQAGKAAQRSAKSLPAGEPVKRAPPPGKPAKPKLRKRR